MPVAQFDAARVVATLLADPRVGEIAAHGIGDLALLRLRDLRVDAEVLARGETEAEEGLVLVVHVAPIRHQPLELGQRLLDLRHRARAVDELAPLGVELAVSEAWHSQRTC